MRVMFWARGRARFSDILAATLLGLLVLVFAGSVTAQDGKASEPPAAAAAAATDAVADGEAAGEVSEPPSLSRMAVPIIGMGLIFYFIVLRPQKKARKKQEALVESLKKHDRVVTIGGIVGTIISIDTDNEEVVLEVGPDTQLRLLRRSIQGPKPFGSDVDSDSGLS
jgi:preprotein translocase subunit YajC